MSNMHVVLVEPEIPPNTGNVSRSCAITRTTLHLVKPLGFSIENSKLKRAGLDYWDKLSYAIHDDFQSVEKTLSEYPFFLATTKGNQLYHQVSYPKPSVLVFGKETEGLSDDIINKYSDRLIRIPMGPDIRSLNLSNSVSIILFEALRQNNFPRMY